MMVLAAAFRALFVGGLMTSLFAVLTVTAGGRRGPVVDWTYRRLVSCTLWGGVTFFSAALVERWTS